MKNQHILEIISEVFPFVRSEYTQRKTDKGPHVDNRIVASVMLTQFMDLGMAVVAPGNAVVSAGRLDLFVLQPAVFQTLLLETGLEKAAAAAAAVVVGAVGLHVNEVFLAHHGFHHKTQILGNGVAVAFPNDLTGILNCEFDLQILVPVGIDLQFSLPDPFCVIFVDVLHLKVVRDAEFFQSCQD